MQFVFVRKIFYPLDELSCSDVIILAVDVWGTANDYYLVGGLISISKLC